MTSRVMENVERFWWIVVDFCASATRSSMRFCGSSSVGVEWKPTARGESTSRTSRMPGARSVICSSPGVRVVAEDRDPGSKPGPAAMNARSCGRPELSPRPATMIVGSAAPSSRCLPFPADARRGGGRLRRRGSPDRSSAERYRSSSGSGRRARSGCRPHRDRRRLGGSPWPSHPP